MIEISMDEETSLQINAVYKRFSEAYTHLDADGIASTYAEDGVEVYLLAGAPPAIVYGRESIREEIKRFFDQVRTRGHHLSVTFRVMHREITDNRSFDTGFYHVSVLERETEIRSLYGKVAIILQRKSDGAWEYLYDANGSATQEEFEKAVPIQNEDVG
jgi:uncharacterized protein (TIGR02246 family)